MRVQRLAIISVHASPLEPMGGKKAGGMNVYIRKLAQEFGRRGVQVDIFTRQSAPELPYVDESLGDHVRVICILAGGAQPISPDDCYPHLPEFTAGVIAFATRYNLTYDLIYSHYWLSGWVANRLKAVWGVPFIQMFHTLGQMKNRVASGSPSPNLRINTEMQITRWADRIIAATPAEQVQLRWLYRVNRRKVFILSPGVDLDQFHPIPNDEAKARLNIAPDNQMLLFAGRIEPLKGIDTVIEALAILRNQQPDLLRRLRFLVVGGKLADPTDSDLVRLVSLVNSLNLGEIIQFVGAKDQAELPDYYAAATAVVVPSDYESFGMVALEAMASGTPVIATEVGGLAFLVKEGETGFLVPTREPEALAHRIALLLSNPAKLEAMRTAAHLLAQQYTWSTIAYELLKLFEDTLLDRDLSHHKH